MAGDGECRNIMKKNNAANRCGCPLWMSHTGSVGSTSDDGGDGSGGTISGSPFLPVRRGPPPDKHFFEAARSPFTHHFFGITPRACLGHFLEARAAVLLPVL